MLGKSDSFGARLEAILRQKEWTQTKLAEKVFDQTKKTAEGGKYRIVKGKDQISGYISGRRMPSELVYEKILKALNVTSEDLPLPRLTDRWLNREVASVDWSRPEMIETLVRTWSATMDGSKAVQFRSPEEISKLVFAMRARGSKTKRLEDVKNAILEAKPWAEIEKEPEEGILVQPLPGDDDLSRLRINVVVSSDLAFQIGHMIKEDQKRRREQAQDAKPASTSTN